MTEQYPVCFVAFQHWYVAAENVIFFPEVLYLWGSLAQ